jgi:hypothetical protein
MSNNKMAICIVLRERLKCSCLRMNGDCDIVLDILEAVR